LIILNYHRASGGDLRQHLLYLRRHYRMLHLEEALEELYAPTAALVQDRRTPLALTFDDGYVDNYTEAFALVCELQIPITIFLIPGYLDSGEQFWWGEGTRLVRHAKVREVTFEARNYRLVTQEDRASLAKIIDARLRYAHSVTERESVLANARALLAVPQVEETRDIRYLPMTWGQVIKMRESGRVSFGAHTMHHPILSSLQDLEEVRREVVKCREALQKQLGEPVRAFAYPVGKAKDIGQDALSVVKEADFTWAVTTVPGVNTPMDDPLQLKRMSGGIERHWIVMAAELSGVWGFFSVLWKRSR
jgi:peptidoglycan/xylan/chitin deacetylase (PgdA/CDA1 family)